MESREELRVKCRHCGMFFDPYIRLLKSEETLLNEEIYEELDIRLKQFLCENCKSQRMFQQSIDLEEKDNLEDFELELDFE